MGQPREPAAKQGLWVNREGVGDTVGGRQSKTGDGGEGDRGETGDKGRGKNEG